MGRNPLDVTRFDRGADSAASGAALPRARTTVRVLAAPVALALALTLTACSTGTTPATSASSATPSTGDGGPASADPSAAATAGPVPTPVPTDLPKIERPGAAAPTVSAKPEPFSAPVAYPDGVTLEITGITPAVESTQGPGAFTGRQLAVFDIVLKNDSSAAIELNQVAVTVSYGSGNLSAQPVYASETQAVDFGGTVAPGASAKARYAFAVPAAELGKVRMVVDFDGIHASAVFEGEAKA